MLTSMMRIIICFTILFGAFLVSTIDGRKDLRIVGGHETTIFRHPYLVSLRYKECSNCPYVHECGGIIYSPKVVLTAAHCVYKRMSYMLYVVAQSENRAGNDGIIMPIGKIIIHEKYNPASYENDIALLLLSMELPVNPALSVPVKMAERMPSVGSLAVVSGWGQLDEENEDFPSKLHDVEVYIVRQTDCIKVHGEDRIKPTSLCAGVNGGGRDACTNDSGGPLLSDGKLVGIVSWSIGCGRPEYPGVYTNVVALKNWIQKNAGKQISHQFYEMADKSSS